MVGITETQLREEVEWESEHYKMIWKGRSNWKKRGGGVGLMVKKGLGVEIELVEVGKCHMSEDILAANLWWEKNGKRHKIVMVVCYMTAEGVNGRADNTRKYRLIERIAETNRHEQVIVMGDMNGHVVILGEPVNANGQLLLDFMEENELENLNMTIAEGKVTWYGRGNKLAIDSFW